MSLYAQYLKEREGKEIVEFPEGFASYRIMGTECYIENIYVTPEKRQSGVASQMADLIAGLAKEKNCKYLTGSVCPSANGSTTSLKVLLGYGFKLYKSEPDMIYFIKELH